MIEKQKVHEMLYEAGHFGASGMLGVPVGWRRTILWLLQRLEGGYCGNMGLLWRCRG